MSDRRITDYVEPVPEAMLEGKTRREQSEVAQGHRALTRLREQEQHLATQANLTVAKGEVEVPKPLRRVPHRDPHKTVKVTIPKALQKSPSGEASLVASSGLKPNKQLQELVQSVGGPSGMSFGKQTRLATAELKEGQTVKNSSPSERIAILYTPTANVRTTGRNDMMRNYEYQVTYRSANPPPPARTVRAPEDQGVFGRDPQLSHFLPLEECDDAEYELRAPEEWVAIGAHAGGTPARSRWYGLEGEDEVTMKPCRVLGYDPDERLFTIVWNHNGKQKKVRRLNLLFDGEDEDQWLLRLESAEHTRAEAEAEVRLSLYVESIPDEAVTPIDEDLIDRILSLVAAEFPLQHLHVIETAIAELREMHLLGSKRAVHDYKFKSPEERERLHMLGLPAPPAAAQPSLDQLLGTIDTPSPNFEAARAFCDENLFMTHALLASTIHSIHGRWAQFADHLLCEPKMRGVALPCELHRFFDLQSKVTAFVAGRLKDDWSVNVITTIQNELDQHFNFFEESLERYEASRMKRFCTMVNLMMKSQLRQLLVGSITAYCDLLTQYRVVLDDDFDVDADNILELPEDAAFRQYWEQRAIDIAARRAKELEAIEASRPKQPAKKPNTDTDEMVAEHADEPEPQERPPLEFDVYTNATPYSRRILEMSRFPNGLEPLFVVRLVAGGCACRMQPSLEDVQSAVLDVLENFFVSTNDIRGIGDQLFPMLRLKACPLRALDRDEPFVKEAWGLVQRILAESLQAPNQLLQMYKPFDYILMTQADDLVDSFKNRYPPAAQDDFDATLERLATDMDRIRSRTMNEVKFELIKVDCEELKNALVNKARLLSMVLMDQLAQQLSQETEDVIKVYEQIHHRIGIEPKNPEELQELKAYIDGVPKELDVLGQRYAWVSAGNDLLVKYRYTSETYDEEFKRLWHAFEWPKTIGQVLEDSEFKYREYRNRFQLDLRADCEKLTEDIATLASQVEDLAAIETDMRAGDHYESVKKLAAKFAEYNELIQRYNRREAMFGMPVTQWAHLKEIKTAFEPYNTLWDVTANWRDMHAAWTEKYFDQLDPNEIETCVNDWWRKINQLSKRLKDDAPARVCAKIKAEIEEFKPHVPLIRALRGNVQTNPMAIRKIANKVGQDNLELGKLKLHDLFRMRLPDHLAFIEEVADNAEKLFALQKQLDGMEEAWRKMSLTLEPHKETGSYKLKANEDIEQQLDDHAQKTQVILGSPAIKQPGIKLSHAAEEWRKKLELVQNVLEQWYKCQSTWSYLQPVFTSGDIAKALPSETRLFDSIDASWKEIMTATLTNHLVMQRCADGKLLDLFTEHNRDLDIILKQLHAFLETKRMAFPRFYFISNDELLRILSDSKDPFRVQPYLAKCFEGIKSITFADQLNITAMESAEGEVVPFSKIVNPADYNNAVEQWLAAVENSMCDAVRSHIKRARDDYPNAKRADFILRWPGQVVIAVCSLIWTHEATEAMALNGYNGLEQYHAQCKSQLEDLVVLVRDDKLKPVQRCTLEALVVIEVHAKDVILELAHKKVDSPLSFDWLAQLRYYWEENNLHVRATNATLPYGYEYLGNTGRLVITQLTDRCYRTLMGALHLNYGGAPEGPAGTGKTETTKDLAKAIAKQCVVYNCSDQITYKDMAKLFKGLSQAGAWGCFDEFNRIEVQVLSVIAQQVATIQEAIAVHRTDFLFDGVMIKLKQGSAVFITMNPGYAGRAELPDNLKALFRPVAMMVPNYAMIGEIQLYSYGFINGKALAEKIVATYSLCSEQLSSQDHYDYGMRAVKSVLTAAGRLKRKYPNEDEGILMLRSIQDVNLPKFLTQDVALFKGIISDLFPGVVLPAPDYTHMTTALEAVALEDNLQLTNYFKLKCFETYEMIVVRHGMMLVGLSYGGKTKVLHSLAKALTIMHRDGHEDRTRLTTLNPKAVTLNQLYGVVDVSGEWSDGVLSNAFRSNATDNSPDRKWLVLDGPVDAVWIENMNTVLDDNKKLCLTNGDIIPMGKGMNMIFEVGDLQHASPATVSRCGMVYVEPDSLGWRTLVQSYRATLPEAMTEVPQALAAFDSLIQWLVEPLLTFVRRNTTTAIPQGNSVAVAALLRLFETFMVCFRPTEDYKPQPLQEREMLVHVEGWLLFSIAWGLGGCLYGKDRITFNATLVDLIASGSPDGQHKLAVPLPEKGKRTLFDCKFKMENGEGIFVDWLDTMTEFIIPDHAQYHELIVPTADTERYNFLLQNFIEHTVPCLLVGETGTGKTVMMKSMLKEKLSPERFVINMIQFSAQTTANQTQDLIEAKADVRRRKGVYGPPVTMKLVIFVDDLNMPQLEEYGAQPAIELIRQWLDHGGWYNHRKDDVSLRRTEDLLFLAAMGPPGGGRNPITQRLSRHFNSIAVPSFDEQTLKKIFCTLMDWIVGRGYTAGLRTNSHQLVAATIEVYETLVDKLKPTPEKSHYLFNLRDVSKVFQGVYMANAPKITDTTKLYRLWAHEVSRAFADRFTNDEDNKWFIGLLDKVMTKEFKMGYTAVVGNGELLFTDFLNDNRYYEEVDDFGEARKALESQIDDFNNNARSGGLDLVVFKYVIEHVSRIGRILRQPFGHALLIGVGGSGRTSCTKLAAKIQDYNFSSVVVTKGFNLLGFREFVKKMLMACAKPEGVPVTFFVTDTHIVDESFLEDITSLLNTGEIPGLMAPDELTTVGDELKNVAKEMGRQQSRDSLVALWTERCRTSLHVVLAFSPIGSTLRERLRKFPSLVNCTTIDWFREWPEEGLRNVAARFLNEIDMSDDMRRGVSECFVQFQTDVRDLSKKYLEEARQHNYVTPTSYVELLNTFRTLLDKKRTELTNARNRYDGGLRQLTSTAEKVDEMKQELDIMKPQLKLTAKETEALIETVSRDSEEAQKVREKVAVEEAKANAVAKNADAVKRIAQDKVAAAQPALKKAQDAASSLDVNDLRSLQSLKGNAPEGVKFVIEGLCVMLGGIYKPQGKRNAQGKLEYNYWDHARVHLMNSSFKDTLLNFNVDTATEAQIEEARKYLKDPKFQPEVAERAFKAAPQVVNWVKYTEQFYVLNKEVKPLLADQERAEKEYAEAMAILNVKMAELKKVDDELATKQAMLDETKRKKQELEDRVAETDARLRRANTLMGSLGGEKVRYGEESKRLSGEFANVLGDVVLSAATIAYLGPFQNKYRVEILPKWQQMCRERRIPSTDNFVFERFMGDPLLVQDWKLQGLPSDSFSVDNAIIMANSRRYPLLVDPQLQANRWIRNMELARGRDNLVVVRPNEENYARAICLAVSAGKTVLLENVEEELDPILENLLLKRIVREGNLLTVTIGDPVEWNENFRMYLTTKLPRPHYQPEVSTKVTLCNFMITPSGLMDQLLAKVVQFERPDVEAKKQKMTIEMAQVRIALKQTEDDILSLLAAEGNILANESAIQQLDRARVQSQNAASRSQEIALAEKNSEKIRAAFRPVAHLGSSLFFCVTELANIDPMYQYSLQFYIAQFQNALRDSEKGEGQARIDAISTTFQQSLYKKVARGLFAKDQLLFSFIMCLKMLECDPLEVRWLLMGGFEVDKGLTPNPFPEWLPDLNWRMIWRASTQLPKFKTLAATIAAHPDETRALYLSPTPLELPLPGPLAALDGIHRLVVLRCLRSDKMVTAVQSYVQKALGDFYVEPPIFSLEDVSTELHDDPSVPIIFVLSPGADPNTELERVANIYFKGNSAKRLTKLSLGQGQDVPAKAMIEEGRKVGNWVLLQNCHLFKDFMPALARIIEDYSRDDVKNSLHREFRLWLTSMPSENFPVSVLQNGAKLVQEPPKGLRSNLLRSYMSDPINNESFFGKSNKPETFRKLLFGLCFFHSLVQERRKFGPLGFNIPYEFNDTDMRISVRQLMMFVNENTEVPYEAITYLAGQCNYGGRVTDDWDRRCLMAMLSVFYTPSILEDDYVFSPSGEYHAPPFGDHASYVEYIRSLPLIQTPEVFGLHLNADITKDERESKQLMDAVLATQPRESSGSSASDPKTIVYNMAADIHSRMPPPFNTEDVTAKYPITYEQSMNTVLLQELIRYNLLIVIVRRAMSEVQKAIKGEVVMSAELEQVFNAMYDGRIPASWKKRSYPSLKPFGAYIDDLLARLAFLQKWIANGPPPVFWISGFFFTQSFLTGVKQNYARKARIEIDKLTWEFTVMTKPHYEQPPPDGCFIHGLFLEGAGWDTERGLLCESKPKELFVQFPILQLMPARPEDIPAKRHYACPTYKTTDRRGVLSTTGHSTNFIMVINLPRDAAHDEAHWIKRGAALFTQLEY